MPRYFFTFTGEGSPNDQDGVDLADAGAAQKEAVVALAEALRDAGERFWNHRECVMSVTDERGREVCRLSVQGWASGSVDPADRPERYASDG